MTHTKTNRQLLVLLIALLIFALSPAATTLGAVHNGGFEKGAGPWKQWPRGQHFYHLKKGKGIGGSTAALIQGPGDKHSHTLYSYARVKAGAIYELSWWYALDLNKKKPASNAKAGVKLAFNKPGGGNGSAGTLRHTLSLDSASKWRQVKLVFIAPKEANKAQLGFSLSHITGNLRLDNITLKRLGPVAVNKTNGAIKIDGHLDDAAWKSARPLQGFWNMGSKAITAAANTTAYIAYGQDALYVAFRNQEKHMDRRVGKVTKRDGPVWGDDSVEVFVVGKNNQGQNTGVHLIVNYKNTKTDLKLTHNGAGDIKWDINWNGKWQSATWDSDNAWFAEFKIPYSTLGFSPKPDAAWKLNFARERYAEGIPQRVQWNRVVGGFTQVDKFATLKFSKSSSPSRATLSRFTQDMSSNPLAIKRPDAQFKSLLTDEPGNYDVGSWYHGVYYSQYSKSWEENHNKKDFIKARNQRLKDYAQNGFNGPPFPWVSPKKIKLSLIEKWHNLGMDFPYFIYSSAIDALARKNNGAKWYAPTGSRKKVSITDPAVVVTIKQVSTRFFKKYPDVKNLLYCIDGIDEPSNGTTSMFSMTKRPKMKKALIGLSKTIKSEYGYDKYGLYDSQAKVDGDTPFERIAFWRWWNAAAAKNLGELKEFFAKLTPGVPFMSFNVNATGALGYEDVTALAPSTDWVSSDPYPSKTMAKFSRARALYHVGFTTKVMADLGHKPVRIMPQLFIYYGGTPTPGDIREWTSQALKNGAIAIKWYELGPANVTIPKTFKEAIRVSKVLTHMNHLPLPQKTKTAILWSNTTRWAQADKPMNAAYSLYTLLGEKLGAWFNFVSDTQIAEDDDALDGYKLIYAPQLKYVSRKVAKRLIDRVKDGATLVIFAPQAFTWARNGTKLTDLRKQAGGTALGARQSVRRLVVAPGAALADLKAGAALPLTPVAGRVGAGKVEAFALGKLPAGAVVLAKYPDGSPAAYRVKVGQGAVIWFAAQPFGNSELAIKKSAWLGLLKSLEQRAGEKLNWPIWNFLIPPAK